MKPTVIMHMGSSIDGKIVPRHWPKAVKDSFHAIYEAIHAELKGDAWIVGRVTMAEFAKGDPKPMTSAETFPRTTWKAAGAQKGPFAVAIDQGGKLHLNISHANGDPIIAVLPKSVSDDHLAELRRDQISYIFAGDTELDLALAITTLAEDFGIARLLLEGGGGINGSFLAAGLVNEISLLVLPVADGNDVPTLFKRKEGPASQLKLLAVDRLDHDVLHLRYSVG